MALGYKTRRRLSLLVLFVGLPVYLVLALNVAALVGRSSALVEFGLYVVLGTVWILPLRFIFLGVGKEDPKADQKTTEGTQRRE